MINNLQSQAPNVRKIVSTICPRNDDIDNQKRVDNFNTYIKQESSKAGYTVVDNDNNFKLKNNDIMTESLNRSGLHLSRLGTRQLLRNFAKLHQGLVRKPTDHPQHHHPANPHNHAQQDHMTPTPAWRTVPPHHSQHAYPNRGYQVRQEIREKRMLLLWSEESRKAKL